MTIKLPLEGGHYIAHTQLSLAVAQSHVTAAHYRAVEQRFQEFHLLMQIRERGGRLSMLDPETSVNLARLARETLASEYELALSRLKACRKELDVLQNAVDEALAHLTDADDQLVQLFDMLDSNCIYVPNRLYPHVSINPTYDLLVLKDFTNTGTESEQDALSGRSGISL
jgi:predicted nuclease with TOPRIM domain